MGGHDLKHPDVPDWRIYRVEDVPELVKIQKNLAARGLKYPWLRNEVWRYSSNPIDKSPLKALKFIFLRGFKYGVAGGVALILAEKAYMALITGSTDGEEHH